jgi:hypothetical protein
MMISKAVMALGMGVFVAASAPMLARAETPVLQLDIPSATQPLPGIIAVADGCGWGFYRGPYGACHQYGTGPYPSGYYNTAPSGYYQGGYYAPPAYSWNGCPPGAWRGNWGYCHY